MMSERGSTAVASGGRIDWMAWMIVLVSFVTLSVSFSTRAVLGLAMPEIEKELGWTRTLVSDGQAWALIVMAMMAPIAGNLVDRFGARLLLGFGLAAIGIGMFITAGMHATWQFYLAYSGLAAVGFGMAATHVVSTIVSHRFERHRGLAVGIATSGSTAGQLLVVPLVADLMETTSWRASYVGLAIACLVLVPAILFLLRGSRGGGKGRQRAHDSFISRLWGILGSWVFQALFWSFFICGFTTAGVIETHLLPYAALCGFPPLESATAYGLLSAVNLGGMILSGWLTDRMNRPLLLAIIYVCRGLTFILLAFVGQDLKMLLTFAVIFGLFDYSTVPPTASLVASHLGLRVMGLTMGLLSAGHSLGAAVGVFLAGRLYDAFGRYDWIWFASLGLAIVAGLLALSIRENREGNLVPAAAH
jgi:MFS family permease